MQWKFVKKLNDVNFINQVESKLAISFPIELKEIVLKYNNGAP